MRLFAITALLLLALPAALPARAQDAEQARAEERLRDLRQQMQQFETQLSAVQREEASAAEALGSIDREIRLREELVASYAQRRTELGAAAAGIEEELVAAEVELDQLREEYGRYARQAYVHGRIGDLALILSASSINQMLLRARYLQRFSRQRERKADAILQTQADLAVRRAALDSTAAEVEALIAGGRAEQEELAERKRERARLVTELRERRGGIEAELAQRQEAATRLQRQIQSLIAEAEAERRRAAEEARRAAEASAAAEPGAAAPPRPAPAPAPEISDAELDRLSSSFRENRGRLPWPASGVVTEPFGNRRNPVTGTTTFNPGMLISTSAAAPVKAVLGGAVSRVFVMPFYGTCVLLTHGDFVTVYGNLSGVGVRQGQRVEAGGRLGQAGTAAQPLGAGVFFGVYESGQPVDPAGWLRRR